VAFLIDNGATVIDFGGPWEVFQDAAEGLDADARLSRSPFILYTVAPGAASIETEGNVDNGRITGLEIVPDFTFDNAPTPGVVVIGAQSRADMPAKLDWVREAARYADVVLSVCTGAFLLANTGLLDGLSATTHHAFYDEFERRFPRVNLIRARRFVDNGTFLCAGGLTSGVDGALHVVARYLGDDVAQRTADYMEHDSTGWRTGARYTE
jgi:transcriptional regulator GlxA family with amidase domain